MIYISYLFDVYFTIRTHIIVDYMRYNSKLAKNKMLYTYFIFI